MISYERKFLIILSAISIVLLIANTYLHFKNEVRLTLVPAASTSSK